ncbi:MAG: AAA family ATPase, partial [Bacteroidales bacterium]|nr:AAA family ATPase [Bacteroidales bacterium]
INFDKPDAKQLIAYINTSTKDDEARILILDAVLSETDYYKMADLDEIQCFDGKIPQTDIFHILSRYNITLNDFGIDFDPVDQAYKGYDPALDPSVINPTRDKDLLERYKDYSPRFILDPLIFMGGFNIIGAERGTGKTRMCLALAYHMIFERDEFLGCPINVHGDVLYINMEIPECDFKFFLEPIKDPFLREGPETHTLYTLNTLEDARLSLDDIDNQIARIRPKLLIIDSFKMFTSFLKRNELHADLNNESVLDIFTIIKEWRKRYGVTVLLTNHTNKGTSGQNGHSDLLYGPGALFDYADQIFLLRKASEAGQRLVILTKSRYKEEGSFGVNLIAINNNEDKTEITFDLLEENVNESDHVFKGSNGRDYPPEMILNAQERYRNGESTREIAKALGVHHSSVARWVKRAENVMDPF